MLPVLCVSILFRPLSRVTLSPTGFCGGLFKWSVLPSALWGVSRVLTGLGAGRRLGFTSWAQSLNGSSPKAPQCLPRCGDSRDTPRASGQKGGGPGGQVSTHRLLRPPRRPAQADGLLGQSAHEALTPLRLQEAPSRLPQLLGPRASPAGDHVPPASAPSSRESRPVTSLSQIPLPFLSGGRQWLDLGSTLNPGRSYLRPRIALVTSIKSRPRGPEARTRTLLPWDNIQTTAQQSHAREGELWSG